MSASAWIKLRCDLDTDPRVLSIADMIAASSAPYVLSTSARDLLGVTPTVTRNALRDVTLAALFRVWRDANRHTTDGVFKHCTVDHLDTISHIPGFGRAMMHVGWVTEDAAANTVTLVNFLEMNSPAKGSITKNAERQARHRQKRNALRNVTNNVTPPVTDPVTETADIETETDTKRESTAATQASHELALQADAIAAMYPRADSPLDTRADILAVLQRGGTTAEEIRQGVAKCVQHIRQAPGGSGNRYVPSAREFFAQEQWRSPESFQGRWQGKGGKASAPVPLSTPAKSGF